jgi:HrpA-like RNA helicase
MFSTLFDSLLHLPISTIANEIADEFANFNIPIITSPVASGKTMIVPAACAQALSEVEGDNGVWVLCPSRYLANNAAQSLRKLLGPENQNLIGCINSNRSGDDSITHPDNRIIFTTVGYALAAHILTIGTNFIFDEAHETSIDMSLAKAYLEYRISSGSQIRVGVMSATMDVSNEMGYWGVKSRNFQTETSAFPVTQFHRPSWSMGEAVMDLIENHDRTGILVFVSGKHEIEDAITNITETFGDAITDYEIMGVHGLSSAEDRHASYADPKAKIKILVGTNVIESGVNFPWVDGGVSSGRTKVMHVTGNVHSLNEEDLPAWRIRQQEGRVRRFKPGVFILTGDTPIELRREQAVPDIKRLPLTELVMHVAGIDDLKLMDLNFSYAERPDPYKLDEAVSLLSSYGLIEEKDGYITLTDDGKVSRHLPLSFNACVGYCEALRIKEVAKMLPLIAMYEIGDIRYKYNLPLSISGSNVSDTLTNTIAAIEFFWKVNQYNWKTACEWAEEVNLNVKKLKEFDFLLKDLEKKTNTRSDFKSYLSVDDKLEYDAKRVLFRMGLLGMFSPIVSRIDIGSALINGMYYSEANLSKFSVLSGDFRALTINAGYTGTLRVVTPKEGGRSFVVLENATAYTTDDFSKLIPDFGESRLREMMKSMKYHSAFTRYFLRRDAMFSNGSRGRTKDDNYGDFEYNNIKVNDDRSDKVGSLGDILQQALLVKS